MTTKFSVDSEPISLTTTDVDKTEKEPLEADDSYDNFGAMHTTEDFFENPLDYYVNWKKPQNNGLFYCKALQSFTENITLWKPALYPFFGVYLNMPGHRYNAINSIFSLCWSMKFFWGLISDSFPIFGKRRIYYMTLGFTVAGFAYLATVLIPMPDSYYAVEDCKINTTLVQNESAADTGMLYIAIMALAVFATGVADLAGDALVVDYTREEKEKNKGRSNAWAYICSRLGTCFHYFVIGFALNTSSYGGSFCEESSLPAVFFAFSYRHVLMMYCIAAFLSSFISTFFTFDRTKVGPRLAVSEKLVQFWETVKICLFQQVAFLFVIVLSLLNARSSALVKIQKHWAKVDPLMNSSFAMICSLLAALGMFLFQKFALNKNWNFLFIFCQVFMLLIGFCVESITIFDIIRSQYFYFTQELVMNFGNGFSFFILLQLAAETAQEGLEAVTFGVMMTNATISTVFSSIIGNLVSAPFGVTDDSRFLSDEWSDRTMVFGSISSILLINLSGLVIFHYLCPKKRSHLKRLRTQLGDSEIRAVWCLVGFVTLFLVSIVYNIMIIVPSTQCSFLVGGQGC